MNIAFPAFFIYLLILPGIILRYYYRKSYSEQSPVTFGSIAEELAYGVLIAATLHLIWGCLSSKFGFRIDLKAVFLCLTNQFNSIEKSQLDYVLQTIIKHPVLIFLYFISINAFAIGLGYFLNWFVRHFSLDIKWWFFRFPDPWYYLFNVGVHLLDKTKKEIKMGSIDAVLVSVTLMMDNEAYLYWGILSNYYFNKKGELDRIELTLTHRRLLSKDSKKGDKKSLLPDKDPRFYPVRGDYFVIPYSDIKTLNIEYLELD